MSGSVTIFHNVVWSRHKGQVFSALHQLHGQGPIRYTVVQIAETEHMRLGFSEVDYSAHQYPMRQLFKGCYEDVPRWKMTLRLVGEVLRSDSRVVVLPGYHLPEFWAMLFACIVTGKRRAVFCDSTGRDRPRRLLTSLPKRLFFALCQGYFGFGERSREYLESLGARRERIFIPCQAAALPAGYTPEQALARRMLARAPKATTPDAPAPEPQTPVFLYVGRLSEGKGLDTLLEAFAGLLPAMPAATLRLAGSGPMAERLPERIDALGLDGAVMLLGSVNGAALEAEYDRATCLVLPSYSEPWGLVVNEALAHGCPAVVSDNCGCVPELVREGETGLAVPARDAAALQAALGKAVQLFADTRATAQRCIDLIGRFDPAAAATHIDRGCASLLRGKARTAPHPVAEAEVHRSSR
ncbi:glycosyltransferase [Cupriavidus necator]